MSAVHDLAVEFASGAAEGKPYPFDALGAIELVEFLEALEAEGWTFVPPAGADGTHPTPDVALFGLERLAGLREVLRNAETALAKTHPAEATALMLLLNGLEDLERGEVAADAG